MDQTDQKIVQWVQCDDKLQGYNAKFKKVNDQFKEQCAPVKELKAQLEHDIMLSLDVEGKSKSDLPIFNIPALQTSIKPHMSNSYENITNKFLKECFQEYFSSSSGGEDGEGDDEADKLLEFIKQKRNVEKKYTLRRDILID
jgi:hypothetical protein